MTDPDPTAAPTSAPSAPPPAEAKSPAARTPPAAKEPRDWVFWTMIGLGVLVIAYLIGLIVDNSHKVRVGYVFGHSSASLVWIVLIAAVAGFVLGVSAAFLWRRRGRPGKPAKPAKS